MTLGKHNPGCDCCDCGGCSAFTDEVDLTLPAGLQGPFGDCTDCAAVAGTYRLTRGFTDANWENRIASRFRSDCYWGGVFSTPFGAATDCLQGDMYIAWHPDISAGSGTPADYQGMIAVKWIGGDGGAILTTGSIYGPNGSVTANATVSPTDYLEDRDCSADGTLTLTTEVLFAHDFISPPFGEFNPDCEWQIGDSFVVEPVT